MDLIEDDYIMDVYTCMKQRYGADTIILFHVGDFFEAYIEDSRIVAQVLGIPRKVLEVHPEYVIYVTRFRAVNLERHRNQLHDAGYETCTSEVRGPDGTHILKIIE